MAGQDMQSAPVKHSRALRGHFTSKSAWWFSRKNLSMPRAAAAEHCSPASQEALRLHSLRARRYTGSLQH